MFGLGKKDDKDPFKPAPEPRELNIQEENVVTFVDGSVLSFKNGDSAHQEDGVWFFENVRIEGKTYDQLFINDTQIKMILCNRTGD